MANQEAIAREPSWRGSNRIAALDIESEPPNHVLSDKEYELEDPNHQVSGFRKFLSFVGPGFLVSLAYLDPGNLETDLQAGSNDKYELLWVILVGLLFALIIQSLAANLGVATGKHLAEICRSEYPKYVKYCLWILAELSVIAADIPEVIGTAFALNLLFHIPIWAGVLITGSSTLLLLGLQRYGIRKLELLISTLVFLLAACFFTELAYVKPKASDIFEGMFVPKLKGNSATGDAVALFGALIMPHNLFLHSALVLSRKVPQSVHGINSACKFFLWEAGFALFVAFWINVAMISVTASVCNMDNLSQANQDRCNNLTLDNASFLLKNSLGKASSIVYGISLLASGQSSAITGTYAGQFIMQGFLDLKMKKWLRNLVTRTIAITPSLVVSIIGGSAASGKLIIIASMILSFELPFALIPLLKFSSGHTKMGPHSNSIYIIIIAWLLGLLLVGINVYYLSTGFVGWLIHSSLPKAANVLIGLLVFPMMAIYIVSVLYLTFRKDTVVTFKEPSAEGSIDGAKMEKGLGDKNDHAGTDMEDEIPYREDLAHMAFPE